MVTKEDIAACELKALQALASVVYDLAGPTPVGEEPEAREERLRAAGRFLYDCLMGLARSRAAAMLTAVAEVEAAGAAKQ